MEKATELIIPLIHKNRWYREDAERREKISQEKSTDPSQEDTVESQAVKELIEGVYLGLEPLTLHNAMLSNWTPLVLLVDLLVDHRWDACL